ncbi:MAG: glycosyltransferase family 4 protein [Verrucomicrobiota bacterium]
MENKQKGTEAMQPVPKRILMTADTVGGVWTYALELCRALGQHGIQIGLATMGERLNFAQRSEAGALPNVKIFESCYKLEWMEEPRADLEHAANWLLELEASFRPDVVHLNSFAAGALPWRKPKIVVGHSCVLSWWRAVHGCEASDTWDEYRETVLAGLHGADLVVAPSRAILDSLNEYYGPFQTTAVIPNGRSLPGIQSRARHDFILAAGRLWDEAKNISTLAEVAPRLPWPVYVAGSNQSPDGQRTTLKNVECLGKLSSSEMISYLERASIYALPARYEPFGLSILEAALAGCALVLGDIPSLREIWRDAALFVDPENPAALEAAVRELISNPAQRNASAAKANAIARQFTPERMAAGYLAAYASVMAHQPLSTDPKPMPYANRTVLSHPAL